MSDEGTPPDGESTPHHRHLDKAFAGGLAWTVGAKGVTQAVTWLSLVIAARLLSLSDFGIVEMAGVVANLTNLLAEFGMGTAVMQMRELDRPALRQLNTISLTCCTVAFLGIAVVAPLVADFFRSPQLRLLVIVNSLGFFVTGVQAVPMGLLQRDMDYRRLSLAEAIQVIIQAVVTVGGALAGMGYWALVAGPLAGKGVSAALTAYWRPVGFGWPRWKDVAAPLRFGVEISLNRIAVTAYSQADTIIVGRMLGQAPLGAYRLAVSLAAAPADKIALLLMRVTGPLFARIQTDFGLVRRYFLFISDALALSVFPLVLGLAVVAPEMVRVVLGPRWDLAVVPLEWLAVFMTIRTLNGLMSQVLISLRFTTFSLWISLITFVIMPTSFFVAAHWGINAVAAAWLIMAPATMLPPAVKLFRTIHCSVREYFAVLIPPTVGSAAMLCVVLGLRQWVVPAGWPPAWKLVLEVMAGGAVYGGILLGFYRPLVMRYVQFLMRMRKDRGETMAIEI